MPEIFSELDTEFTTADTVTPVEIAYDGQQLSVRFAVYGSPIQEVVFADVRAFSWTGWEGTPASISPDRVYSVSGSTFIVPWVSFAVGGYPFRHFKLGFNAEGKYLDVVATRMEERKPNQPATAQRP